MNKSTKIGTALACIAVILLIITLSMPWWTFKSKTEFGGETQKSTHRMTPMLLPQTSSDQQDTTNISTTINITTWITTIGTISSVIAVMMLGIAIGSDKSKFRKIGAALLIAGLILAVVAPVFFMVEMPNSYKKDRYEDQDLPDHDSPAKSFFGSYDEENSELSWRGGIGWFLSFISAAILGIGAVLALKSDKRSEYYQRPEPQQHFEERGPYEEQEEQHNEQQQYNQQEQEPWQQKEEQANYEQRRQPQQPQNREPWQEPKQQNDQRQQYQQPKKQKKDERMIDETEDDSEWEEF